MSPDVVCFFVVTLVNYVYQSCVHDARRVTHGAVTYIVRLSCCPRTASLAQADTYAALAARKRVYECLCQDRLQAEPRKAL